MSTFTGSFPFFPHNLYAFFTFELHHHTYSGITCKQKQSLTYLKPLHDQCLPKIKNKKFTWFVSLLRILARSSLANVLTTDRKACTKVYTIVKYKATYSHILLINDF